MKDGLLLRGSPGAGGLGSLLRKDLAEIIGRFNREPLLSLGSDCKTRDVVEELDMLLGRWNREMEYMVARQLGC